MKNFLVILSVIISCIVVNQSLSGCAANEPIMEALEAEEIAPEVNSIAFGNSFKDAYKTFLNTNVVVRNPQSRSAELENGNFSTIYLAIPDDEDVDLDSINTVSEVYGLVRDLEIEYDFEPFPGANDSITVDNNEIDEAFVILIAESKNYLYGLGVGEQSIQDELVINDTDERTLVPTALALLEYEENGIVYEGGELCPDDSIIWNNNLGLSRCVTIDWQKAMKCAIKAIGADIIKDLVQLGAKKVTYEVFKKVLKTAAKRVAGPLGVAWVVLDFVDCYWGLI